MNHIISVNSRQDMSTIFQLFMTKYSLKLLRRYEKCIRVSSVLQGKFLPTPPSGRVWAPLYSTKLGGNRTNPGIKIIPLPRANIRVY